MSQSQHTTTAAWRGRTLARLAVVQAIFQALEKKQDLHLVTEEFLNHRFNDDSILGLEENMERLTGSEKKFFDEIMRGAASSLTNYVHNLKEILPKNWPWHRVDPVIKALLLAAMAESSFIHTPKAVLINEYMDVAHSFFPGNEPRIVNGVLDKMIKP